MKEYVFHPILHLHTVPLAYIVELNASLGTPMVPSSLQNLASIICPIEIENHPTSWGSSDQMQWQHHVVHIGEGKHKLELIAKTNWTWQNRLDIPQAALDDTLKRITAHQTVKELLATFLAELESSMIKKPKITLKILLEEVSNMRVSDYFSDCSRS